jgi:hypothetical protein
VIGLTVLQRKMFVEIMLDGLKIYPKLVILPIVRIAISRQTGGIDTAWI